MCEQCEKNMATCHVDVVHRRDAVLCASTDLCGACARDVTAGPLFACFSHGRAVVTRIKSTV